MAGDEPHHRSSSPLKRRASSLDPETADAPTEDVEMVSAPAEEPANTRSVSVDMLRNEPAEPVSKVDQIPPIDEQIKVVTTLCEADAQNQLKDGDSTYLLSKQWLGKVQSRSSTAKTEAPDGEIGPVDNSDIVAETIRTASGDDFVRLKPGLGEESFQPLPEDAWKLVVDWYGEKPDTKPIVRTAHNTNSDKNGPANVIYEWHPLVLTVHRLWSLNSNINIPEALKSAPAPVFVVSRSQSYVELLQAAKKAVNIDGHKKIRAWRISRKQPAAAQPTTTSQTTPPDSREPSPAPSASSSVWKKALIDVESFTSLERGVERDQITFPGKDSDQTVDFVGLGQDEALVLEEHVYGDDFVSTYVPKTNKVTSLGRVVESTPTSGRSSPSSSGPMTRGRTQKSGGRTLGCVGLVNLGNTCYMNSALQCLRNVEELTKYFLVGEAENELNTENPLGKGGNVALVYGSLLREIFKRPVPPSVAPRQFKNTIGRYAPSFSGYGQQDSHEFLAFLLDGLQEDLSRVKKKPYIEKPDSTDDMVNNPEKIREMANQVWDITKKRDDSVIADLFTGLYKSTLVCPVCDKISITFDPYNNLTMQLPIETTWNHQILFFPLNDAPVQIRVDMDKHGSIKTLKEYVSKKTGVDAERLVVAEEFKQVFYKLFDDFKVASEEIGSGDKIAIYELEAVPTNYPGPKKTVKARSLAFGGDYDEDVPNWDDPMADRLLVPVVHRKPLSEPRYNKSRSYALAPHFIILTPEEARSSDAIRRKVLEKVAAFSTHPGFHEDDEDTSSESIDPDVILTTGSDADSSGDSKVVAQSVDGEDDVVDVTMKDSDTKSAPSAKFRTRRPKWVDTKEYLSPQLQSIFEMSYFKGTKEIVPVGWSTLGEDKNFPKLSSREPHAAEELDGQTDDSETTSNASDDEMDSAPVVASNTRMTEESESDEEVALDLPVRSAHKGVKVGYRRRPFPRRRMRAYRSKGTKTISTYGHDDSSDDGPLIRIGEGLVVDWNLDAFEALFEGESGDTQRGMDLTVQPPILPDPELEAKQKARLSRRKNGITLDDCFDEFGKEEILSEMDTWYCPRCKEHRRASKKLELWKTPDILIIHLKRFSSSGYHRNKLDVNVDFPLLGLDLTKRVVEKDGKEEIFDLFAVDDHWGGLGGGHYTAFAKSFIDGQWYEYNDSSVSLQKDLDHIVSAGAYLLFYRRRSSVPLGGPRFQDIVDRFDNPRRKSGSDDEQQDNESGEEQRLVGDSSLRGSSSALTGVGAVPPAAGHSQGSGVRARATMKTTTATQDDELPGYSLLPDDDNIRASVEDDEGIDMMYPQSFHQNTWDFAALDHDNEIPGPSANNSSYAGSLADRSDIVQHDSSAGSDELASRLQDFEDAIPEANDASGEFIDPSPVPDMDPEQVDQMDILSAVTSKWNEPPHHTVTAQEVGSNLEDEESEAAEIHVEEGEGLK